MAKSKKMAIRKDPEVSRSFEFAIPSAGKAIMRALSVGLLMVGLVFIIFQADVLWKNIWPVKKVILQGENQYLQAADIVNFVNSQSVKGMLAIDLEQLQKNASKIGWVQSVEVRKVWPDQLVFVVNEHHPVARFGKFVLTAAGTKIEQGNQYK